MGTSGRLVLKRRVGERIRIGENIWIVLHSAGPDWARLGIEAPHDLPIHREEIIDTFGPDHDPADDGRMPAQG